MPDVIAYTDGGCRGNPGPGGWGCLIIDPRTNDALERCGGEQATTNNRMELLAAIMALRSLKKSGTSILIHSDSQYVIKASSEWIPGWKARGWKRKEGPLKNVDLLQEIDGLLQGHQVTWKWVKGHDGNPGNERVDGLANQAMDTIAQGGDPTFERRIRWQG
ncbi:MAG: ribonuclease HI [Planctomycetes bacterium]|nr:ribonuclease HI [Planctomycetota bacterium]